MHLLLNASLLVRHQLHDTEADMAPCVAAQAERARIFTAAQQQQQQQQQLPPGLLSVRIYTAAYSGPLEKAAFQGAVARENSVFADLIRAKQHLVLPLDMGQSSLQQVCGCLVAVACGVWVLVCGCCMVGVWVLHGATLHDFTRGCRG
jgi:hypothetical protein